MARTTFVEDDVAEFHAACRAFWDQIERAVFLPIVTRLQRLLERRNG